MVNLSFRDGLGDNQELVFDWAAQGARGAGDYEVRSLESEQHKP